MKNRLKALLTLVIMAICCLPASTAATARIASAKTTSAKAPSAQTAARPTSLRASRDSLLRLLAAHPEANQTRIDILTNLSDVSMALSNDRSSLVRLWDEGIRQQNPDAIINAGRALTLDYLNRAQLDSATLWLDKCRAAFSGPMAKPVMKYLTLMHDIRDMGQQAALARRLVDEQLHIRANADPYDRMTILYKLGTLALTEWDANEKIDMKSWDSYMAEGYRIALTLPLAESYNFRHQFLMALSFMGIDYTRQFIRMAEEYRALPQMKNRPFLSHRSEIVGSARMFAQTEALSPEEIEAWYSRFCDLTTRYPYDCQMPYQVYFYEKSIHYYLYKGDNEKVIECCDSVIVNAPRFKLTNTWPFQLRGETLGKMGRWREAYENSVAWMASKDSLANVSSQAKLMELQTQYDVDRLRYETQVSRQRFLFSLGGCVLLAVLLAVLYLHFRALARKNRELVERIRQQEAAEEQVEAVAKATPVESLTSEEQLFRHLQELLQDTSVLTSPKLRREDLAEMLGTNSTYVADAIRTCTDGLNVSEYINRKRVRHARYLFECEPEMSIDEVADRCGFASRSRFHTAFKEQYNMTPGEFRKAIKS